MPLSEKSKNRLMIEAQKGVEDQLDKDKTNDNMPTSLDCKNWKNYELTDSQIANKIVFYKKNENAVGLVNEKSRTILILNNGTINYFKVSDKAIVGLLGKKGLIYRPIKNENIYPGITGLLQSLAILGVEFDEQWHFSIDSNQNLRLFFHLFNKGDKNIFGKYATLTCSLENNCELIGRGTDRKDIKLEINSPEHIQIKSLEIFNTYRLEIFNKFCGIANSNDFKKSYITELSVFRKNCSKDSIKSEPNFSALSKVCTDYPNKLLPMLNRFQ